MRVLGLVLAATVLRAGVGTAAPVPITTSIELTRDELKRLKLTQFSVENLSPR